MSKPKYDPAWSAFIRSATKIGFGYVDLYAPGRPKMVKAMLFAMTERDAKNFWRSAEKPSRTKDS